jgi:signal transduction histidine kinase
MQGNLKGMLKRNYAGLAQLYDMTGKTNEALKFYKLLDAIKDSIFKEDLNKQLADFNLKYETEKAKRENEILTKENEIQELQLKVSNERQIKLYAVILLLFAGSILVVLVMRNRNNKKLNDQLQLSNQQLEVRIKQRTKEIEEANKTKDQFFSIIAHDLKSPFNALLGLSVMLDDNYETLTDPERKEFIHYLREAVDTLYQLLENLLNWSVSQRGILQLFPSKLQINNIIEDTLLLFSQQAQMKNITFSFENKTHEQAYADADTVKTILRNLISNAIKFSPLGGKVIIKTALSEISDGAPLYEVQISDSGVGIPQDKQEIIFENPMEVKTKGTSNEKGTGLGLLICKDFVQKNNGQISLISEPGKGSTFIFTLPLFKNQ